MVAKLVNVEAIGSYFESLPDPRHTRNRKHLLIDIVVIAVCGMVCGCDGPTAIHRWASNRREWLQQSLALPNGIPSRDGIRRLLMALKPEAFQKCFQDRVADAIPLDSGAAANLYLSATPLTPVSATIRYVAYDAVQRPDGGFAYRVRARLDGSTTHRVGLKGTVRLTGHWVPLAYWVLRRPLATIRQTLGV